MGQAFLSQLFTKHRCSRICATGKETGRIRASEITVNGRRGKVKLGESSNEFG